MTDDYARRVKPGTLAWFLTRPATWLSWLLLALAVGLYAALAVWAAGMVIERNRAPPAASVVAVRTLPPGRLFDPADVRVVGLSGYVTREVKAGQAVTAADLAPLPSLAPPAGHVLAVLPLDRAVLDPAKLDPGSGVQLCQGAKPVLQPKVQAVLCDAGNCSAAVAVPSAQAALASGATVRPAKTTCG